MAMNQLDQLRAMTTVVADSGDFDLVRTFQPVDATTNPSLVFQAAQKPEYQSLIEQAVIDSRRGASPDHRRALLVDSLFVLFGVELLKIIPGRVSTEVDASLSFDTKGSIERAVQLISLYEQHGIPRERVLIKLAATVEGIRAAEVLEMVGIHCNMTLIFSIVQAAACAEINATIISPFVGRVLDWHMHHTPSVTYTAESDPGVALVKHVYWYFKHFDYRTSIMAASFRNKGEILALAGCDFVTISPKFLDELMHSTDEVQRQLSTESILPTAPQKIPTGESSFRFLLNEDQMATEKLSEGIRIFSADIRKLVDYISLRFGWSDT